MFTPYCYKQLVVKCDYVLAEHSLAVIHLTINIFVSNYQHLLVIFTAALSPTTSSTHYYLHTSQVIKHSMCLLHIRLQLFTITPIFFYYNYT